MINPEPRDWCIHPRRHWCVACKRPVRRIVSVKRVATGHDLVVECHGVQDTALITDRYTEDHPDATTRWFADALILARLDRHGNIDTRGGLL